MRRVVLLTHGRPEQTTVKLFQGLSRILERFGRRTELVVRNLPRGVVPKLRALARLGLSDPRLHARQDVLVVHSALALNLLPILVARMKRVPVIAFVWDLYPESTVVAGNIKHPLLIALYRVAERVAYRASGRLVVPSQDYIDALPDWCRKKSVVLPLWPVDQVAAEVEAKSLGDTLSIGFAGQINAIRGLEDALRDVLTRTPESMQVEGHLYSADPLSPGLARLATEEPRLSLELHGFLPQAELQERLADCDFGLVCVDESFELPSSPSKIVTYLAAGIPALYSGRRLPALERQLTESGTGVVLGRGDSSWSREELETFLRGFPAARRTYLSDLERKVQDFAQVL